MSSTDAASSVQLWFDRKFEFTFPIEQYPNLCVRLRGGPPRLEDIVRGISRDVMIRKPRDKWSAQEHAGHLADLEALWMARVEDFLREGGGTLTIADLTNRRTTEAGHNDRDMNEILSNFRASRIRLVERAEKFPAATFARSLLHPRLKQPMRLVDHLYFVAEHDDHHLARIWELISAHGS
jgi:uncharacterized damage-inducible protein DinB